MSPRLKKMMMVAFLFCSGMPLLGIEVSLQTTSAAYCRLSSSRLSVPIDWSWEWLPADATKATLTLSSPRGGLQYSVEVTDRQIHEILVDDFSGSFKLFGDDSITAELEFSNVAGETAGKTFVYDFYPNGGVASLHEGRPGEIAWRRVQKDSFLVPFDATWFGRQTGPMTVRLTDLASEVTERTVDAAAGRFAFGRADLHHGVYHLDMLAGSTVLASGDVELISSGLILVIK